jgi:hypothetical protein
MENSLMEIVYIVGGLVCGWLVVLWLDKNVFNKNRYYNKRRKK